MFDQGSTVPEIRFGLNSSPFLERDMQVIRSDSIFTQAGGLFVVLG